MGYGFKIANGFCFSTRVCKLWPVHPIVFGWSLNEQQFLYFFNGWKKRKEWWKIWNLWKLYKTQISGAIPEGLLQSGYPHLSMACLWLLSYDSGRAEWWVKSLNISCVALHRKRVLTSCFRRSLTGIKANSGKDDVLVHAAHSAFCNSLCSPVCLIFFCSSKYTILNLTFSRLSLVIC